MSKIKRQIKEFLFFAIILVAICSLFAYQKGYFDNLNKTFKSFQVVAENKVIDSTDGFTLVPIVGTEKISLINMSGVEVHSWNIDAARVRLKKNGNILVIHGSKWGINNEPWRTLRKTLREYDWNGNVVWEYTADDIIHHDVQILENENLLFPVRKILKTSDKIKINDTFRKGLKIRSDTIYELNKNKEVVWKWDAHNWIDINFCGQRPCVSSLGKENSKQKLSDWSHLNTTAIIPQNIHYDNGDKRFKPGNIIVLPRNFWMIYVVDKESKQTVWEYSGDYEGGLSGGHEAQMIKKGYPGEGNILVFDNGRLKHKGRSFILEINPLTKEVVWVYENGKKFFSNSAGSVQRLKNGNTLISEDLAGRVFEVTKDKKIVWKFKTNHRIARAKRYSANYTEKFNKLKLY